MIIGLDLRNITKSSADNVPILEDHVSLAAVIIICIGNYPLIKRLLQLGEADSFTIEE